MYEPYKATRDAMPEDIQTALPYLDKLLEALNIPVLRLDGYEADDLVVPSLVRPKRLAWKRSW